MYACLGKSRQRGNSELLPWLHLALPFVFWVLVPGTGTNRIALPIILRAGRQAGTRFDEMSPTCRILRLMTNQRHKDNEWTIDCYLKSMRQVSPSVWLTGVVDALLTVSRLLFR
jgi:hypothetical protein